MALEVAVPVQVSGETIVTEEALEVLPAAQPVAMVEDSMLAVHAAMLADVAELIASAAPLVELCPVLEWDSATIRSSIRGPMAVAVM